MEATRSARAKKARQTRAYASPRRQKQAAETKAAVIDAARALFSERGWAGTGMRDVARAAEVSVETVYSLFKSKPDLFQATLDVTIVGDTAEVPMAERPEFLAVAEGSPRSGTRSAVGLVGKIHQDAAGLERALREAAAAEPSLREVLRENEERRRSDNALGFELITGRRPTPTERDGCWALLSFEVYELLVERSGWSLRRYEEWVTDLLSFLGTPEREKKER